MTMPRAIIGPVMAMARPARPPLEARLVCEAASALSCKSAASRAAFIAHAVATVALKDLRGDAGDRFVALLDLAASSPIARLAIDAEIDTVAIVRAEAQRRLEARHWQHLPERDWEAEDRALVASVAAQLAKRYSRHLAKKRP